LGAEGGRSKYRLVGMSEVKSWIGYLGDVFHGWEDIMPSEY